MPKKRHSYEYEYEYEHAYPTTPEVSKRLR